MIVVELCNGGARERSKEQFYSLFLFLYSIALKLTILYDNTNTLDNDKNSYDVVFVLGHYETTQPKAKLTVKYSYTLIS